MVNAVIWYAWEVVVLTGGQETPPSAALTLLSLTVTVTSWPLEMWQVDCCSGWWDWLQGLYDWSLKGDNLPGDADQVHLAWNGNAIINLNFKHFVHHCYDVCILGTQRISGCRITWINSLSSTLACVTKAAVMRWQRCLMSMLSTQERQCRAQ